MKIVLCLVLVAPLLFCINSEAQIETQWLDTSASSTNKEQRIFFTNRKLVDPIEAEDITFKNRWLRQTKNLYFCRYDFESKDIMLKYRATKTCSKKKIHTEPGKTVLCTRCMRT
jgi:hypothetical protein